MNATNDRFLFSSAPDSWGVLDYPGPSWEQSYETMLDEMAEVPNTGGVLLTFDDFVEGVEKFGTRVQPLMKSRRGV